MQLVFIKYVKTMREKMKNWDGQDGFEEKKIENSEKWRCKEGEGRNEVQRKKGDAIGRGGD